MNDLVQFDRTMLKRRVLETFLVTYALLLMVAGLEQIQDPFFRFDDYPALVGLADEYYHKAVTEGRWVNYLWHLRGFHTPAWYNFQLYLSGWSLFISAAAVNIFRNSSLRYPLVFAGLVAVGPQTTSISAWYNTLVPGVWLLAAFAVSVLFLPERKGRWIMAAYVPVTLQAYTPYPFLLLGLCLLREDRPRTLESFFRVVLLFSLALGFGVGLVYSINFFVVGTFDVEPHAWRKPTPASDLSGIFANIPKVTDSLVDLYQATGFGNAGLSIAVFSVFLVSFGLMVQASKQDAGSIVLVIAMGLGLLALHSLLKGIELPFRSTGFVWFMLSATLVLAAKNCETSRPHLVVSPLVPSIILTALLALFVAGEFRDRSIWQRYVKDIASHLPTDATVIYIFGSFEDVPRGPDHSPDLDLVFQLEYIAGVKANDCLVIKKLCSAVSSPFGEAIPNEATAVRTIGGQTFVLPAQYAH